jgi:hypothetical protein
MGKEPRPGDNEAGAQYTHTEDREVFQHPISTVATSLTVPCAGASGDAARDQPLEMHGDGLGHGRGATTDRAALGCG